MTDASPIEFLARAQEDPKLSARVLAAVERGGRVTAEEVLEIAREFGYSFTRAEFEREVKRNMAERFKAGDESLADVMAKRPTKPPQSSCARGCVSWTTNWHPTLPLG
jgi:Nif11 domain